MIRWVARPVLIAYLVVLLIVMIFENRLIFIPSRYPEGNWRPFALTFEDAWFPSSDGTRLHGWYLPHREPRAVVLFCHGNAGNVTHRDYILEQLQRVVGVSVLIFDYRGYGQSEGSPNEAGILADARAARRWLARRAKVAEQDLVLMGESLGGAVAADLAADGGARALILESTFTSLPEVAAYHYPWLPLRWLLRTRLNALEAVKKYRGPLLLTHGDRDTIVPYDFGKRLFEAANEPKQLLTVPGGDHNDPRNRRYYDQLRAFVEGLGKEKPQIDANERG